MSFRKFFAVLCLLIMISIASSASAVPIDTDFYPPDVSFSPVTPPINFKFVDSRIWTEKEKNIIREAIREWDVWICYDISFIETTGDDWDLSLRWAGADLFKNYGAKGDYTRALGVWSGKPGEFSVPWDTKDFPLKEIYFNSQYFDAGFDTINNATWYIDNDSTTDEKFDGYDLLSVAKHEFGHFLGIRGDWGQDEPFTDKNGNGKYDVGEPFTDVNGDGKWGTRALPWTRSDEVMWGRESPGVRKHLKESDLRALRELGTYHVVPEPSTLLLFGTGLAGIIGLGRNRLFKKV